MASSPPPSPDAGYATPAALVLGLALALVATATLQRSAALVARTRRDFERVRLEYALDGAQLAAAAAVVRSGPGGPYRWTLATEAGWVEVVAEPEQPKLTPAAASRLDVSRLRAFGVADPEALQGRLAMTPGAVASVEIGSLDPAAGWRDCAGSMISALGATDVFAAPAYETPRTNVDSPAWRVGELWRLRVTTAAGWQDDRVVRFTGDAQHPAAVVARRWSHGEGGHRRCDDIFGSAA